MTPRNWTPRNWPAPARKPPPTRKAEDIQIIDLRGISDFTDFFVVCSGTSDPQLKAIASAIREKARDEFGIGALGESGARRAAGSSSISRRSSCMCFSTRHGPSTCSRTSGATRRACPSTRARARKRRRALEALVPRFVLTHEILDKVPPVPCCVRPLAFESGSGVASAIQLTRARARGVRGRQYHAGRGGGGAWQVLSEQLQGCWARVGR